MILPELSVVITTWGDETLYTQQCLGRVRRWKDRRHEIIVVAHDETPLHRQFLELCAKIGLVDALLLAVSGHGHVRGVNLGFERARADLVFNLTIDTRVGGELIGRCAGRLATEQRLGLIGWHYDWDPDFEGSLWRDGELECQPRWRFDPGSERSLSPGDAENIRRAGWYTGRVFGAVGLQRITCCNGSFFGIRRALWNRLGGFDEQRYPNHFADDFLTYAVLDQGLDVANIPPEFRCGRNPAEFLALTDLPWRGRADPDRRRDWIPWSCGASDGRFEEKELVYLGLLERCLGKGSTVVQLGPSPWSPRLPSGAVLLAPDSEAALQALPPTDVMLVDRTRFCEALTARLRPGGQLVVFGLRAEDRFEPRIGSLGIRRRELERTRFARK